MTLRVWLLGEPRWQVDDRPAVRFSPKDAALVALLAADGPQPRQRILGLLWPDASPERAASSLRQRTSRLNRATGSTLIETGDAVGLGPDVWVDILNLSTLGPEWLTQAGVLLAGIDLGELDEADAWLAQARSRYTEACAQHLSDHAEDLERAGLLRDALPIARRIAEWLPLAEHAARRVMRLHYLRGDRGAAQDAFWRLHGALRDELGIRPSAETLQLFQTIESAQVGVSLPSRPVPTSLRRPPVLIGRAAAWRAMTDAWQSGVPFLLVGDAGLGKSRLLEDFAAGQPAVVCDRAQPGDDQSPYALLGRVLVQVQQRHAPALSDFVRGELARLRPDFGTAPSTPAQAPMLWHAVGQMLAGAMAQGLRGLLLDDLHGADAASIDALRWLCASPALRALRLGLAARPTLDASTALMAWLGDSHRPTRIDLLPLSKAELSELLASLALPELVSASLTERLYRHAAGHPFFTLSTLHEALACGEGLDQPRLPYPSSVEALLDARLRALPVPARELLSVAAVGHTDLKAEAVAEILGCPVLSLSDAWGQLEAAQVLTGESFTHDLMHEAALRTVPLAVRQALHRRWAALLARDASIAPARIAAHWEGGLMWAQAGRCWHDAGRAAARAGRLQEQAELFERAAACHAKTGDADAQFDALHARLAGLQLQHGGAAVLAALPALEALAGDGRRRLLCRLARCQALLDGDRTEAAAAESARAMQEAAAHPSLRVEAATVHAQALAQAQRHDEALAAANTALDAARSQDDPVGVMRAWDALHYAHYSAGRLVPALEALQQMQAQAEALGHHLESAEAAGNTAALLAVLADVPGTYAQARACSERFAKIGLSRNSTFGIVNRVLLGSSAMALGRIAEGLDELRAAVEMADDEASPAAHAKARLHRASALLGVGAADEAVATVAALPDGIGPGARMQAEWIRLRAAAQAGAPTAAHARALQDLAEAHRDLPVVASAWFELSWSGPPAEAIAQLGEAIRVFESLGLEGQARALRLRQCARWAEIDTPEAIAAAARLAADLAPHALAAPLTVKLPPGDVLGVLADAFGRAGDLLQQRECREAAQHWLDGARPEVPAAYRAGFERVAAGAR